MATLGHVEFTKTPWHFWANQETVDRLWHHGTSRPRRVNKNAKTFRKQTQNKNENENQNEKNTKIHFCFHFRFHFSFCFHFRFCFCFHFLFFYFLFLNFTMVPLATIQVFTKKLHIFKIFMVIFEMPVV